MSNEKRCYSTDDRDCKVDRYMGHNHYWRVWTYKPYLSILGKTGGKEETEMKIRNIKGFATDRGSYKILEYNGKTFTVVNPFGYVSHMSNEYLEYLIASGRAIVEEMKK